MPRSEKHDPQATLSRAITKLASKEKPNKRNHPSNEKPMPRTRTLIESGSDCYDATLLLTRREDEKTSTPVEVHRNFC